MKKICMVIPSFTAKGGIASVVSGYRGSELENKYKVHYIETYSDKNFVKKVFKAISSYFAFVYHLIIWKPDIVHIHSSFGASFYRKLPFIYISSWLHIPIVNHIHGSAFDDLYCRAGKRKKKLVIDTFQRCDKIIVLSEEWRHRYKIIINEDKMVVIQNFSVLHNIQSKELNGTKTVLFLGFLSKDKGCFDIPLIIRRVVNSIPDVKFVMAGVGTTVEVKRITELIHANKIEKNVLLPGWIRGEAKDNLLKNSDVFFLPSYSEGMPMSILEAMGYELPIISSNVGGIPQIVHNGVNGFSFNPGDIEGFSSALVKILTDDVLLSNMGKKSIEIIENGYSLENHIEKIVNIYREVLHD